MNKMCCICGISKAENEYSFKSKAKNLRSTKCKECHRQYVRNHYENNKRVYISRAKKSTPMYRNIHRQKMLEYLQDKACVDCGITDPRVLDFDHIEKKYKNIADMKQHSWSKVLEEISKCEIRCANCHRIKTSMQFSSYKN